MSKCIDEQRSDIYCLIIVQLCIIPNFIELELIFTSVFINYEPCEHISSPKLLSFHCGFNLDLDFGHDSGHTKTFNLILTLNVFMTSTLDLTLAWHSITLVLDLKLMELDPDLVVNFDFQYYIVPHLLPQISNWS